MKTRRTCWTLTGGEDKDETKGGACHQSERLGDESSLNMDGAWQASNPLPDHSACLSPFTHPNEGPQCHSVAQIVSDHSVLDLVVLRGIGADLMLTTVGQAGLLGHSGANARPGWATYCGPLIELTETITVLLPWE